MTQLPAMTEKDLSEVLQVLPRLERMAKQERENRIAVVTCSICLDARSSVMLMPCRHRDFCARCVQALPNHDCPICRQPFTSTVIVP